MVLFDNELILFIAEIFEERLFDIHKQCKQVSILMPPPHSPVTKKGKIIHLGIGSTLMVEKE